MLGRIIGKHRPSPALAVASLALVLAMAGVGVAAIPDSGGVVHACYAKNPPLLGLLGPAQGDLRVIDTAKGQGCASSETALSLASDAELAALGTRVATLESQVSGLQTANTALTARVSTLEPKVSALQSDDSAQHTLLAGVTRTDNTLTFTGMNLQLESGSGHTDSDVNGLGNLIIGYNEDHGDQTGSHNLILGKQQTFTSYGGLIGGFANTLTGAYSDVFGVGNVASNYETSVLGGVGNTASAPQSSVLGGQENTASAEQSSVSGGRHNTARGTWDSILGGYFQLLDVGTHCATFPSGGSNC